MPNNTDDTYLRPNLKGRRDGVHRPGLPKGPDPSGIEYPTRGPRADRLAPPDRSVIARALAWTFVAILPLAFSRFCVLGVCGAGLLVLLAAFFIVRHGWRWLWDNYSADARTAGLLGAVAFALVVQTVIWDQTAAFVLLFIPALFYVRWLGREIATEHMRFLTAAVPVSVEQRERTRRNWEWSERNLEVPHRLMFCIVWATALAACLIASPVVGLLFYLCFQRLADWLPERNFRLKTHRNAKAALNTWCCYNAHGSVAVGLFRMAEPDPKKRILRVGVAIFLLGIAVSAVTAPSWQGLKEKWEAAPPPEPAPEAPEPSEPEGPTERRVTFEEGRLLLSGKELPPEPPKPPRPPKETAPPKDAARAKKLTAEMGTFAIESCVSLVLTPILPFLLAWVVFRHAMLPLGLVMEELPAGDTGDPQSFEHMIDRIQYSQDAKTRDYELVGLTVHGDMPILLDGSFRPYHCVLRGAPGSGKTSFQELRIAQMLSAQDRIRLDWLRELGHEHRPASFVVFDFKGERSLFHTARLEAARAGFRFRAFSLTPGHASAVFNPFAGDLLDRLSKVQQADNLCRAIGVTYSAGSFGSAPFFSSVHEALVLQALRKRKKFRSFVDMHRYLSDPKQSAEAFGEIGVEQSLHLLNVLQTLASHHSLNADAEDRIDFRRALCEPEVFYFDLPMREGETIGIGVAKLALFCAFLAAGGREARENRDLVIFLDEADAVVAKDMVTVLKQARSFAMPMCISYHATSQIKSVDTWLAETMESMIGWEIDFQVAGKSAIERLQLLGGLGRFARAGWTEELSSVPRPHEDGAFDLEHARRFRDEGILGEYEGPLLDLNSILEFSSDPRVAFFYSPRRAGPTQFPFAIPFMPVRAMSLEERVRRAKLPWPASKPGQIVVGKDFGEKALEKPEANKPPIAAIEPLDPDLERRIDE